MERAAQGEMTTREAVAYLNEWLDYPINAKIMYSLRCDGRAPVAEKRDGRLVFRRASLDAFLAEYGTDPKLWTAGFSRHAIDDLHARGIYDPQIESFIRAFDADPDGWHPDDAH